MQIVNRDIMRSVKKKRAAKTGHGVLVRMDEDLLAELEEWQATQRPVPSLPEAVRRLARLALDAEAKKRGRK